VKHFTADFQALAKGERKLAAKTYSKLVTAPCMEACPATLDIPGYIELIRNNNFKASLDVIRERCILPGVIGRACTHPCEDACVRKDMDGSVAHSPAEAGRRRSGPPDGCQCPALACAREEKRIAFVGAGPAGLAAAFHLRRMGIRSRSSMALPKAGGMAP
jgi:formate dehydrogenase beta subunit